jgi:hypothetical protein
MTKDKKQERESSKSELTSLRLSDLPKLEMPKAADGASKSNTPMPPPLPDGAMPPSATKGAMSGTASSISASMALTPAKDESSAPEPAAGALRPPTLPAVGKGSGEIASSRKPEPEKSNNTASGLSDMIGAKAMPLVAGGERPAPRKTEAGKMASTAPEKASGVEASSADKTESRAGNRGGGTAAEPPSFPQAPPPLASSPLMAGTTIHSDGPEQSTGTPSPAVVTSQPPVPPSPPPSMSAAVSVAGAQGVGSMPKQDRAAEAGRPNVSPDRSTNDANSPDPVVQVKPQQQVLPERHSPPEDASSERRQARRRPAAPSRERIAANDDVPSIGGLIYALNQRPSRRPFLYAAIASGIWSLIVAAYFVFVMLPASPDGTLLGFMTGPWFLSTVATWLAPIALSWFLAGLSWRAEELHLRSTAMTEVAVRLAEPDRMAEQSVASLGQSVRRQVSFMNDAVSRALGRAGELEALVHNEVSSLEQSYEENERKIRALINELSGERNALMNTGHRFQNTLQSLGSEVPALIEKLNEQQITLAKIIEGAAENLSSLENSLGQQTGRLEIALDERTGHLSKVLEDYTQSLSGTLGQQSETMHAMLGEYTTALGSAFETRTNQMHRLLESGRIAIDGDLEQHQKALADRTEAIAKHSKLIADRLEQQHGSFDTTLSEFSQTLDKQRLAIEDRVDEHHRAIEAHTSDINTRFLNQRNALRDDLSTHQARVEEIIGDRTQTLQTVFEEYARALDSTLANRVQALDVQLVERTKALDDAFAERLRLFDESILRSTMAIDSAVGENAKALTSAMHAHAENISHSLAEESNRIDETLMAGINAVRATSENVTQQSLKAIEGLAGQADLLRNVSENLLGQINSVTARFENQGQAILRSANALEHANNKIDRALKQRNVDLNQTLDRMEGKADELGRMVEGYSTNLEGSIARAENRARLITEELSRGAQARSRAALEDIARIKSETTLETDKALTALKAEFVNVSKEVTERLGSLGTQFTETSGAVREQAARAAQELESEQQRLRQQLNLLPSATEETSAAMRKALHDQLRALDKLTELASRTTSGNESRASRTQPTPLQPQDAATSDTQRHDGPRGRNLTNLTSTLARELGTRQTRSQDASDRAARAVAQGSQAPHDNNENRWSLGDLLARASKDEHGEGRRSGEQQRSTTRTGGGYGLDVDALSRALDAATAATIWSRFRSGQRGFMVPSIYTPEARPLFAQVVRRYNEQSAFRANVDRFLSEFERGLHELDQRDPTRQSSDAQVTTDTGRVYLVLAHAANRLA